MPEEVQKPAAAEGSTPAQQKPAPEPAKTEAPAPAAAEGAKPTEEAGDASKGTLLGEEGAEGKSEGEGNGKPEAGAVPEKYEIKVPEGMKVDTALLDVLTPDFREAGLSNEQVQKFADKMSAHIQKQGQKQHEEMLKGYDEVINEWGKQTKEMLGPNIDKELYQARKALDKLLGPEDAKSLRALLNKRQEGDAPGTIRSGLGNHPLMVKLLIAAGKLTSQDSFVDGGSGPAGDDSQDATIRKHYPSMSKT